MNSKSVKMHMNRTNEKSRITEIVQSAEILATAQNEILFTVP